MGLVTTSNYDAANNQQTKEPIMVLSFEGLPYAFSSNVVYTAIKYDDPGINYDEGWVYDGVRPIGATNMKTYIDRKKSSSTISQKLEQWDGKASVETMNISLVDVKSEITKLISPGQLLNEIINKRVKVYIGYPNISYPEDYLKIFTGYVNQIESNEGKVNFLFTDPNSKRKQVLFNNAVTRVLSAIAPGDTTINLLSTSQLYVPVQNPLGAYDSAVQIGVVIDDEIILYSYSNVNPTSITSVTRGALGTTAASHDMGAEVKPFIYLSDNPVNMALKLMLSGWNAPFVDSLEIRGIVNTDDGFTVADSITFPQGVDLVRDYGLVVGDFVITSGFTVPANNGSFSIKEFRNNNRTLVVDQAGILVQENPPISGNITPGTVGFRSKYDTYPVTAGLGLVPDDVFVERHEYFRDTFVQVTFTMPVIGSEKSGKEFIEKHILKVIGGYSLTQGSKISMGLTHPPLSTEQVKFIDPSNIIRPQEIVVKRGLNTRFFYNEVLFKYAYNPVQDEFKKTLRVIDADAQARMKQVSVLEIEVRGLPDDVNTESYLVQRADRILLRYRYSAETIELRTIFGTGHTIDAGDAVILNDSETDPTLQIANTETGERQITNRVMEVQERSIDISGGNTRVVLLSNNGFSFSDRYGVISQSSLVDVGYSTTRFRIKDSFDTQFPGAEYKKWKDFEGLRVKIHDDTYTDVGESTFKLDVSDPYVVILDTPLSFVPGSNYVMEWADYDETDSKSQTAVKNAFCFRDPVGTIVSGASPTVFTLSPGEGANYLAQGQIVYVMSPDGVRFSPDLKIASVVGDVVTVGPIYPQSLNQDLGFTPLAGDLMQLAGFKDGGAGYRYI